MYLDGHVHLSKAKFLTWGEIIIRGLRLARCSISSARSARGISFNLKQIDIGDDPRAAVIVLDDELIGDLSIAAARALVIAGEIAPLKILTVGFGAEEINLLMSLRAKYFTFNKGCLNSIGLLNTGDGREMQGFLDEYVLPQFDVVPSLLGYSLSGTFALQAVAQRAGRYRNVVAISPSLWAEPLAEIAVERALQMNSGMLCHLAAGTNEEDKAQTGEQLHMFEKVEELGSRLKDLYADRVSMKLYEGETHFGAPFAAICDSLRAVITNSKSQDL